MTITPNREKLYPSLNGMAQLAVDGVASNPWLKEGA